MLKAQNLECIRNDKLLFTQLSFTVEPGEILHIVGENGSGKSSLLQMLIGTMLPQAGEIAWQGRALSDPAQEYYQHMVYVGHKIGVKHALTVRENLQLMAQLGSNPPAMDWQNMLSRFGLQEMEQVLCAKLSAGQRQKVALTRLLFMPAKIWILDEPFTAIDQKSTQILREILAEFVKQGGLVVFTSHQDAVLSGKNVRQLELVA